MVAEDTQVYMREIEMAALHFYGRRQNVAVKKSLWPDSFHWNFAKKIFVLPKGLT